MSIIVRAITYFAAFAAVEIGILQTARYGFISGPMAATLIFTIAIAFVIFVAFKYFGKIAGYILIASLVAFTLNYFGWLPI